MRRNHHWHSKKKKKKCSVLEWGDPSLQSNYKVISRKPFTFHAINLSQQRGTIPTIPLTPYILS